MNSLFDELPPPSEEFYNAWETAALITECRRRGLDWAITPETVVEYQRRKIMIFALLNAEVSLSVEDV